MSLITKRIKLANKYLKSNWHNEPSESVSRQPGRDVRDSIQTMEGKCITTTGTFSGLISCIPIALILLLALPVLFNVSNTYATASSITVSVSSTGPIVMNIPPIKDGKFASSNAVTIGVETNHASGYTLNTSSTPLSYTDTSVNPNVTHTIDTFTPPTGTVGITATTFSATDSTSTTNYNNKWGYLPSKYCTDSTTSSCIDNTTNKYYLPAPIGSNSQILDITTAASGTDTNTGDLIPTNYTVAIGSRLDYTVPQGAYSTDFTFAAIGNPTPYTITYDANLGSSGDTVTNMPDNHTASDTGTMGETTTIASETPRRIDHNIPVTTGYLFAGWCTAAVPVDGYCNSNYTGDANATKYDIGGAYVVDQTSDTNELTLYAIWRTDPCYGKTTIHDLVTCQVKTTEDTANETLTERTQTLSDMQAFLTEPVSDSPYADTSNSGVYKYDSTYFGEASDAANTSDVYYFRGILDQTYKYYDAPNGESSGIPSSGDSAYYQNYVRLHDANSTKSDTCWRIVRTTGSGGTKMIYNGTWDATDGCARSGANTQAGSSPFNQGTTTNATITYDIGSDTNLYGTRGYAVYVGYNYNNDYKYAGNPSNDTFYTDSTLNGTLFKNTNSQGTMTASNLKTTIENWYTNTSNLSNFAVKLETSAGWCNDRSTTTSPTENDSTIPYTPGLTYGIGSGVSFGAARRNAYSGKYASLTCPNITGQDLLTADNGFLNYPLALLTEDEVAFAGHGFPAVTMVDGQTRYYPTTASDYSSRWSYRSFLRSGSYFWLLSIYHRGKPEGSVNAFRVASIGYSGSNAVYYSNGVRPAISLASGTTISGGTGISTDPWVITP